MQSHPFQNILVAVANFGPFGIWSKYKTSSQALATLPCSSFRKFPYDILPFLLILLKQLCADFVSLMPLSLTHNYEKSSAVFLILASETN